MIAELQIAGWVERLGWVLVHFAWEGTLLGLVTWVGLCLLKKTSAQSRYLFLCGAMIACLLLPCVTWSKLTQRQATSISGSSLVRVEKPTPDHSVGKTIEKAIATVTRPDRVESLPAGSYQERIRKNLQSILPYLVAAWSAGVFLLSIRILIGWLQLQRYRVSGLPVQDKRWVLRVKELSEIMGITETVQLLESLFIEVPTVMGWFRPAILVPASFLTGLPTDQVEAILAHELAHIRRHDYLVNLFQLAIETLLFYHPVVWWISNSIRKERENCCDDIALEVIGNKATYVTALAALEESRSLPMAITMSARGGSLLQRIRRIVGAEAGKNSSLLVALTVLLVVTIAGSVIWGTRQLRKDTLTITCTDQLGAAIVGASVKAEWPDHSTNLKTDTHGSASIVLPPARPSWLSVKVHKEGFVPKIVDWTLGQSGYQLPKTFALGMEKAQTIGGVVKNEEGQPVKNAKVVLIIRGNSVEGESQRVHNDLWERRVTTDNEGKWHFDEAPSDLRSLSLTLEHPDYISNVRIDPRPNDADFKQQKAQLIACKGTPVDGSVTDEKGQPIPDVAVTFGEPGSGSSTTPSTKTDSTGHFHFNSLALKRSYLAPILTFKSPDHAPVMVGLTSETASQPIKVVLKSGKKLQVRFVDGKGLPVKGVTLCADYWQGRRPFAGIRFQSDTNGMVVWNHAPESPITYALLSDSYLNESPTLQPTDAIQTVQLKQKTMLSGRVIDAVSKKPISNYQLIPGTYFPEPHSDWTGWSRSPYAKRQFHTDTFRYVFESPAHMMSSPPTEGFHRIRIEAPGYEAGVSRPIANDEGSVTLDLELKPEPAVRGIITAPNGSPVKNAQVIVAGYGNAVGIYDGFLNDSSSYVIVMTDEKGKYELPAQEEDYPIAIVQPDLGYLTTTYEELKANPDVRLLAWGEIEFTNVEASDDDHRHCVEYWDKKGPPYHAKHIYFRNSQPSNRDSDHVVFKHVVAGPVWAGRFNSNEGRAVLVENGKTTKVDLKTGKAGIIEADGTLKEMEPPKALILSTYYPKLPEDGKASRMETNPPLESRAISLRVLDSQGKPIEGATLKPTGMRTKENHVDWYGIRKQDEHLFSSGTTDKDGNGSVSFPARTGDGLTTGTIKVLAEQPDFCSTGKEINLDHPTPITLQAGTTVTLSAQPIEGVSFSRLIAGVDSSEQTAFQKWTNLPDGMSIATHLPDGVDLVQLVGLSKDNSIYFSEPKMLSPNAKSQNEGIKETLKMTKGTVVRGVLDSSVPRPVLGGWIVGCVTSPLNSSGSRKPLALQWYGSTNIEKDGSFILKNLPEGNLEIVAGCDGYVSKDERDHLFPHLHKAQFLGSDRSKDLTISMEPTAEIRVEVLTPEGKPLQGAKVYLSPNQTIGNGNSILGTQFNSSDILYRNPSDSTSPDEQPKIPRYEAITDTNGIAVIKQIPRGEGTLHVSSDSYAMPYELPAPMGFPRRQLKVDVPGTVTVKMDKKNP